MDAPIYDLTHGSFMAHMRSSPDWLLRRVDNVRHVDADSLTRSRTFDIDTGWISSVQPGGIAPPDMVAVPLLIMRKRLLVDFEIRDANNAQLSAAIHSVDAKLSLCSFAHTAQQQGISLSDSPEVTAHVARIFEEFPSHPAAALWKYQPDWNREGGSGHFPETPDDNLWNRLLLESWDVRQLLYMWTYNFTLVVYLPIQDGPTTVTVANREDLVEYRRTIGNRLGIVPTRLLVDMVAAEQPAQSRHLRISAPEGMEFSRLRVQRLVLAAPVAGSSRSQRLKRWFSRLRGHQWRALSAKAEGTKCQVLLGPDRAHVYYVGTAARLRAQVSLHAPTSGFLRASLYTALFAVAIFASGIALHDRVKNANVDASVALLLLVPTLLAAYLARPGEHALLGRQIRPVRYALAALVLADFAATASVALYVPHSPDTQEAIWKGCLIAASIFTSLIGAVWATAAVLSRRARRRGLVSKQVVADLLEESSLGPPALEGPSS